MKNLSLMLLCVSIGFGMFAQDTEYAGPAKMYVGFYYRDAAVARESIEAGSVNSAQMKITSLQKYVGQINEKDPNYSTASMEAEISEFKKQLLVVEEAKAQRIVDQHDAQWSDLYLKQDLDYLFKDANLQVGHNNMEFAQKRLDEFKAKTENVLSKTKTAPEDYVRYISRFNTTMDQFYTRNADLLDDVNNVEEFKPAFFELQLYEAYWDAAQKIYPNEKEFADAYTKILTYRKSVGTLDDVKDVADQNTAEKIKNRKMEVPAMRDAGLEKFVMDAFNATFKHDYGTTLRVVLTQNDWSIEQNALTDAVIGRHKASQISYKGSDGKCYLLSGVMYIHEEYIGDRFTERKIVYDGLGGQEMLCENVE